MLATLGSQAPPPPCKSVGGVGGHVPIAGGLATCGGGGKEWGCEVVLVRAQTSLSHSPPSPHRHVEVSESRTWVSALLHASESCCLRTE